MLSVRRATIADLDVVVPLFDAYRRFYRAAADLEGARRFLLDRFSHNQSVIFLAFDGDIPIGFTQIYPSFSSVSMARIFILNDLFVSPEARSRGAGAALLNAATEFGRRAGAVRLVLSTELTNTTAQAVYEHNGWKRDTVFCSYDLTL
jgi:GNAT superfamily N-acetyltransferase